MAVAGATRCHARSPYFRAVTLLALAALAAALVALAVAGWFSRYAADDYCTAGQLAEGGFVQAQATLYLGWSGRFAATLFATLSELGGPFEVRLLPALALLAWVAAGAWTIRRLAALSVLSAMVLAAALVYATLQTTADLPQVLYWQTGLVTYLVPLVLAALLVGCIAQMSAAPVCFGLALLAGGTSETFAAAQVAALVLALVLIPARMKWLAAVSLVGAVIAFAIVALAPGNAVRQETGSSTPLSTALPQALEFTQGWLRLTFARPHALELLVAFGVPFALASPNRYSWRALAIFLVTSALVIVACMLPAFYALGSNPPGRAQLIPQYVLIVALMVCGWAAGAYVGGSAFASSVRPVAAVLLLVAAVGPPLAARAALEPLASDAAYAAAWDQLDLQIRVQTAAGATGVSVASLPPAGNLPRLDFIGPNRDDWLNGCVARYYGLRWIATNP